MLFMMMTGVVCYSYDNDNDNCIFNNVDDNVLVEKHYQIRNKFDTNGSHINDHDNGKGDNKGNRNETVNVILNKDYSKIKIMFFSLGAPI